VVTDALDRTLSLAPPARRRWWERIREVTDRLHEPRRMSTASLIGFASVAIAFLALTAGELGSYGAAQRAAGANEAIQRLVATEVSLLQTQNAAQDIKIAVLERDRDAKDRTNDQLADKYDKLQAYVQALTVRMAQSGVRDLPPPPK
jgi:hypothetical protein